MTLILPDPPEVRPSGVRVTDRVDDLERLLVEVAQHLRRTNLALRQADDENQKKLTDYEVDADNKLILSSPDGTRWEVAVSDAGALSASSL